jgi:hypothetical protein
VFYAAGIVREVEALGPGADAPLSAKIIAATSLFLWVAVMSWAACCHHRQFLLTRVCTRPSACATAAAGLKPQRYGNEAEFTQPSSRGCSRVTSIRYGVVDRWRSQSAVGDR